MDQMQTQWWWWTCSEASQDGAKEGAQCRQSDGLQDLDLIGGC